MRGGRLPAGGWRGIASVIAPVCVGVFLAYAWTAAGPHMQPGPGAANVGRVHAGATVVSAAGRPAARPVPAVSADERLRVVSPHGIRRWRYGPGPFSPGFAPWWSGDPANTARYRSARARVAARPTGTPRLSAGPSPLVTPGPAPHRARHQRRPRKLPGHPGRAGGARPARVVPSTPAGRPAAGPVPAQGGTGRRPATAAPRMARAGAARLGAVPPAPPPPAASHPATVRRASAGKGAAGARG